MDMKSNPTAAEIDNLFANSDPDMVWAKATVIIGKINPGYDFRLIRTVFDDVMRLFHGQYPGYSSIKTLYHDLPHTLDVFLCAVRLMHGVHVSGTRLSDNEITLILIAALMHDIGYAQLQGEESGTGAQYTQTHVKRGIAFMRNYLADRHLPAGFAASLEPMISGTDPALKFPDIIFPDDRARLLGQLVVTADLTGQMADRTYLEKLLFLYLEFKEAHFGNFQNIHDMLRQTRQFYQITRAKLDGPFGGLYVHLASHFREMLGVGKNYYLESIEKNIAYLEKVIALNEAEYLSMLKRGGIVEKAKTIPLAD
ncbi:MAG: HD domain-containing protein [Nitrosomonadales bacterium]|nr:HD domain-containing protein [Nitrosomonadales bacterium]